MSRGKKRMLKFLLVVSRGACPICQTAKRCKHTVGPKASLAIMEQPIYQQWPIQRQARLPLARQHPRRVLSCMPRMVASWTEIWTGSHRLPQAAATGRHVTDAICPCLSDESDKEMHKRGQQLSDGTQPECQYGSQGGCLTGTAGIVFGTSLSPSYSFPLSLFLDSTVGTTRCFWSEWQKENFDDIQWNKLQPINEHTIETSQ